MFCTHINELKVKPCLIAPDKKSCSCIYCSSLHFSFYIFTNAFANCCNSQTQQWLSLRKCPSIFIIFLLCACLGVGCVGVGVCVCGGGGCVGGCVGVCVCVCVWVCMPVWVSTSLKGHCNEIFDHTSGPLFQMLKYFPNDFVLANIYSHVQFSTLFL